MTRTLAVEEEIPRPAAEVWEALTDWENAYRWMPGIEGMAAYGEDRRRDDLDIPCARRGTLERHRPM